jgi:uncharacterized repeat protein (TIGR03803 family)
MTLPPLVCFACSIHLLRALNLEYNRPPIFKECRMVKPILRKMAFTAFAVVAMGLASQAQVLTTLYTFNALDGSDPVAPFVQGLDGNLYGTTAYGGQMGSGTAFKISTNGVLATLHSFCSPSQGCFDDGSFPYGGLVEAANGNFYGSAYNGGAHSAGSIYGISPSGEFKLIYSFCSPLSCEEGEYPNAGLAIGIGGDLFGGTSFAGTNGDGALFKVNLNGKLTILQALTGPNGSTPQSGMALASNGMFYGTTEYGGENSFGGIVYKMTPSGTLTPIYNFCSRTNCSDGSLPFSKLVQASNGNFYGTTYQGGAHGYGTVFQITPAGVLTTIHSFNGADGRNPSAPMIQATDGNLYGTTSIGGTLSVGNGTIFEITQAGQFVVVHSFSGTDGSGPGGLMQGTDGAIYGSTGGGGSNNYGTIFKLDLGLGPFIGLVQPFGKVGQIDPIIGQGLTGSTHVAINGVPAQFTVVSDTQIQATVPETAIQDL